MERKDALVAYVVRSYENENVIIFARHGVVARREGANELGIDFSEVESCTRAKEYDKYSPGPVPLLAQLDRFRFECNYCDAKFDDEGRYTDDDDGLEYGPTEEAGLYYCCQTCASRDRAKSLSERNRANALSEFVTTIWPEALIIQSYMDSVSYTLPGIKYRVDWSIRSPYFVWVAQADVDEYKRLYGRRLNAFVT